MQGNDIQKDYTEGRRQVEKVALKTIGKTTIKNQQNFHVCKELKQLKKQKREARKDFEKKADHEQKKIKSDIYVAKQKEVRVCIEQERKQKIANKFERMLSRFLEIMHK